MAKIALALFRTQNQLNEALQNLQKHGLSQTQIRSFEEIGNLRGGYAIATIGTNEEDRFADMKSELFRTLRDLEVPKEDAFLFTEGVRRGGKLALVFSEEDQLEVVIKLLKLSGALDLEARRKFAEEVRQRPTEGLSESPFTSIAQESYFEQDFAEWLTEHRAEIGPRSAVKTYDAPVPSERRDQEINLNE